MTLQKQSIRDALLAGSAAILFYAAASPAWAGDSDPLLQLLQQKGVITAAELARVENGPVAGQRDRLVDLLRSKGILSNSDAVYLSNTPRQVAVETQMQSTGFSVAPAPIQMPLRVAKADRPPVAHTVTVSDNTTDGGLYYASDLMSDTSPLSFKLGGVSFYPGAVISATTIFRNRNTGSSLATNFGAIPFSNTVSGNVSESRITAQGTLFDLKAITDIGGAHVSAYAEMDFNGNDAANTFVTANSHTARLRLAYADATWRGWELMFGQGYSMLTPNRTGLGPDPYDVFITNNVDFSMTPGLVWTRAAQVRAAYHPNANWALGVGIESPDQYIGAGEVIYPFLFSGALSPQFDAANQASAPSKLPDVIGKIAFDSNPGSGHNFHAELTGLLTTLRTTLVPFSIPTSPPLSPPPNLGLEHATAIGGGIGVGLDWQVMPNFSLIANGFYSDGGGRYVGGLGPDTVVLPFVEDRGSSFEQVFFGRPSLVHSSSFVGGLEWKLCPGSELDLYYSGAYFARNAFPDITSPLLVKPFIGFGGANSPNSANRFIQEVSADFTQDIWADSMYGVVQIQGQLSYLQRNPWFVLSGFPVHAEVIQSFVDLRLLIP